MEKRDIVIAGNWKMNKTPIETEKLIFELKQTINKHRCKIILFVPYVDVEIAIRSVAGTKIQIGAQNCHWENSGAFTGEISPSMLKEIGVNNVIIGHSERRMFFNETDESINKKIKSLIKNDMNAILCVGETLEQMKNNETLNVITNQIEKALNGVKKEDLKNIMIAYEPIWAIGTGMTATCEQAENVCREIRKIICSLYDQSSADQFIIQYGGSMNSKNAFDLLSAEDIDGGLIGGASLKSEEFVKIVELADKVNC